MDHYTLKQAAATPTPDHESASKMTEELEADTGSDAAESEGGALTNVSIDVADNGGFMVRCSHRQPQSKGNAPSPYVEPKQYAFGDKAQLMTFLTEKLGA